ncbi:MAG TPA: hypothetical protein GX700_17620, partial [Paracoccus sp.]|nr:hypothetical protein [Paracoccus sp. (in: a-proteobacteria)]
MKAWVLGGVTLLAGLVVVGVIYWRQPGGEVAPAPQVQPLSEAPAQTSTQPPIQTLSDASAPPPPETIAPAAPPPEALPVPVPAFDVVRVAEDGGALIAGSAAPGALVILQVDETPVTEAIADEAGQFVAIFALAPSDAVQMLTLEAVLGDGRRVTSEDRVVLTPRPELLAALLDTAPAAAADATAAPPAMAAHAVETGHVEAVGALVASDLPAGGEAPLPQVAADLPPVTPPAEVSEPAAPDAPSAPGATPELEPAPEVQTVLPVPAPPPPPGDSAPGLQASAGEQGHEAALASLSPDGPVVEGAETPVVVAGPPPPVGSGAEETVGDTETETETETTTETEAETETEAKTATEAETAAEAQALAPRAFVLRGSGEVALIDSAPQVMDNIVIDTISYSDTGEVQISGRAATADTGARVQIYLDNRPIALALAGNGDWTSDLPAVDPGVYTLRVDQLDAGGQVVSRFETPFQREDPAMVRAVRGGQVDAAPPAEGAAREDVAHIAPDTPASDGEERAQTQA